MQKYTLSLKPAECFVCDKCGKLIQGNSKLNKKVTYLITIGPSLPNEIAGAYCMECAKDK